MSRRILPLAIISISLLALVLAAGCGETRSGSISQDQHSQIQKGMTLDEVEGIAGTPYRTHKTGPTSDPNIIWYYSKTDGEGLVRISFLGGRVDNISPYSLSVEAND